ncbi:hypothetical protein F4V57_09295 [Acinetobacter qingfengensis]|uniref:Uncharacterized protein n=1 Tax=Acinetobacter qingfengensis TaxID=1262585 RepID=A0A1E7RFY3_9GAMM|nr:hypothetical protein [Acinetobacter qingfengensis]KAA8732748.1 hypothetical protein F4V57_09295 [Acinetobacter qingfengensis]OEY98137.1 hypothetical protein BJI46_01045 [Acinetobacter qingfengensis]
MTYIPSSSNNQHIKKSKRASSWKVIILLILVFSFIPAIFAYQWGVFQKEFVANKYQVAIEIDHKLYVIDQSGNFAFTKSFFQPQQVYLNTDQMYLYEPLARIALHQFKLDDSVIQKSSNPYFSGYLSMYFQNSQRSFIKTTIHYLNAKDSYQLNQLFNAQGDMILEFSDDRYAPDQYRKTADIKQIVMAGMCRSSGGGKGCNVVKDPYLNLTQLFARHFQQRLIYSVNKQNKMITLSFQPIS